MAVITVNTYSTALHYNTNIYVYLPSETDHATGEAGWGYYRQQKKYPVLYLLHGTYGDGNDYLMKTRLVSYAEKYQIAIVMMDTGNGCYNDTPFGGPEYYSFVTKELPLMMQWMFPISDKREENFVCGLSMGGYGALKLGLTETEQFGYIAPMSPKCSNWNFAVEQKNTIWSSAFEPGVLLDGGDTDLYHLVDVAVAEGRKLPKIYLCIGTEDPLYQDVKEFREYLDKKGVEYTYHEMPGNHDWNVWDAELKNILAWLPLELMPARKSVFERTAENGEK